MSPCAAPGELGVWLPTRTWARHKLGAFMEEVAHVLEDPMTVLQSIRGAGSRGG